jgi:hypothetical protein
MVFFFFINYLTTLSQLPNVESAANYDLGRAWKAISQNLSGRKDENNEKPHSG